jgi:hypothetical protein
MILPVKNHNKAVNYCGVLCASELDRRHAQAMSRKHQDVEIFRPGDPGFDERAREIYENRERDNIRDNTRARNVPGKR